MLIKQQKEKKKEKKEEKGMFKTTRRGEIAVQTMKNVQKKIKELKMRGQIRGKENSFESRIRMQPLK